MIDMKCPSCGAGGRVPREKVNVRLTCKKCLRVFHLSPSGQAILGEPQAPKDAPKPKSPRQTGGYEATTAIDDLAEKFSKVTLPTIPPRVIGIAGAVLVVGLLGYWFITRQGIEARSVAVGHAFNSVDMKTVLDMTSTDTVMDAIKWFNDVTFKYNELKIVLGGQEPGIKTQLVEGSKGGGTQVTLTFYKTGPRQEGPALIEAMQPNPSLANSSTKQDLEVPMIWVSDTWGNWVLDGTRTLEAFAATMAKK
jgi:hypothetical protein